MTLNELEQRRAGRVDPADLPHTTTIREAAEYAAETALRQLHLRVARQSTATLAELRDDADQRWLFDLTNWRATLVAELPSLPRSAPAELLGRWQNVALSIKVVDFGLGVVKDSGYDLTNMRLGELMVASGHEVVGADPDRNFRGVLPWRGSIKDVEARIKEVERRRAAAQQQLDDALLDDDSTRRSLPVSPSRSRSARPS